MNRFKHLITTALVFCSAIAFAQKPDGENEVMTKSKGTYTINTTTLCDVIGFKGTTPLLITVKNDKIVKVEALQNKETPKFFDRIKSIMLPKFEGLKFKNHESVDAVSGATKSSNAVKAHVAEAYKYYQKNK